MELNLARDVKDRRKGFYRYREGQRKSKEKEGLPLKVQQCREEAEVWNAFFASVSTRKTALQETQALEARG